MRFGSGVHEDGVMMLLFQLRMMMCEGFATKETGLCVPCLKKMDLQNTKCF